MRSTKVDSALAAAEEQYQDDPERVEALRRTRRFKASWLELAEILTEVRRASSWRRWGHGSFEEYASKELHLRPETVAKLTGSFQFLRNRAPEVLGRDGVQAPIPSYQAIDFLRRAEAAEESGSAPADVVEAVRRRVLDEGAPLPAVTREYKDVVFPLDDALKKRRDTAALRNVAGRLRELLRETRAVPRRLASEVASALDELLEAVGHEDERAA